MKRILLLLVLLVCTQNLLKAQVIDIIGQGVLGLDNHSFALTDVSNIDRVDAIGISKGYVWSIPPANFALFNNGDTPSSSWSPVPSFGIPIPVNDPSIGFIQELLTV